MITAAADGSSLSNPGPAGWAWYVDEQRWAAGGWPRGTNNMGELMAVINLLQQTPASEDLLVLCDSQYVINVATKWIPGWKRRGWRKADGSPVLNVDLIKQLESELTGRSVDFQWVKGHAGHDLNEHADAHARAAATAYRDGTPVPSGPGFAPGSAPVSVVSAPSQPEPDLFSDDPDQVAEHEVISRQRQLLDDSVLLDRERMAELLHPDYVGYEPGGQIRTRGSVLARPAALPGEAELEVLGVDHLSGDVLLLRFRVRRAGEVTLASSLWQRAGGHWLLRFSQQTV